MTKAAERMAYDAGRASVRIVWPNEATDDQKRVGEHHCPFPEGDEQREPWLRGLRDALSEQVDDKDRANLLKRLDDSIEGGDDVSG